MSDPTPEDLVKAAKLRKLLTTTTPECLNIAKAAHDVYAHLLDAKTWHIAEAPLPESGRPNEDLWHIGAPTLRYFDKNGNEVPQL